MTVEEVLNKIRNIDRLDDARYNQEAMDDEDIDCMISLLNDYREELLNKKIV